MACSLQICCRIFRTFRSTQLPVAAKGKRGCRAAVSAGTFAVAVPNRHTRNHNFAGAAFVAHTLNDPQIRATLAIK